MPPTLCLITSKTKPFSGPYLKLRNFHPKMIQTSNSPAPRM
jgi:hypothetical protein